MDEGCRAETCQEGAETCQEVPITGDGASVIAGGSLTAGVPRMLQWYCILILMSRHLYQ